MKCFLVGKAMTIFDQLFNISISEFRKLIGGTNAGTIHLTRRFGFPVTLNYNTYGYNLLIGGIIDGDEVLLDINIEQCASNENYYFICEASGKRARKLYVYNKMAVCHQFIIHEQRKLNR